MHHTLDKLVYLLQKGVVSGRITSVHMQWNKSTVKCNYFRNCALNFSEGSQSLWVFYIKTNHG